MPDVTIVTEHRVIGAVDDGEVRASQGQPNVAVFAMALRKESDDLLEFVAEAGGRMGQASWRGKRTLFDVLNVRVEVQNAQGCGSRPPAPDSFLGSWSANALSA